jgi:uncharacterized membrane protein
VYISGHICPEIGPESNSRNHGHTAPLKTVAALCSYRILYLWHVVDRRYQTRRSERVTAQNLQVRAPWIRQVGTACSPLFSVWTGKSAPIWALSLLLQVKLICGPR